MSFVLVTDGSPGIQYKLNVTPATPLTDILEAACQKLKLKSDGRGLKLNNKALDLSLSFRLAGIPQGSRLLVYRLPTTTSIPTVLVAVQLIDTGVRLSSKYPITSSIWSILKSAEAQSKREGSPVNILERADPPTGKIEGAGRLYYTRPIVQVLSRELSDLKDLALTLRQLGITKGTALLRVKWEKTMVPLEEALGQIAEIFPEEESEKVETPNDSTVETPTSEKTKEGVLIDFGEEEKKKDEEEEDAKIEEEVTEPEQTAQPVQSVAVFKPSSSSIPRAATETEYNEADYEVTVPLAKIHQAHLLEASQGRRLPSDREIETAQRERSEKAKNSTLIVRVRFPDGWIIEQQFKGTDTATDLYDFVKTTLRHPEQEFSLYLSPPHQTIPKTTTSLMLKHSFSSRTLVNFAWKENTPEDVKKQSALTDAFLQAAKEIPRTEDVKIGPGEDEDKKDDPGAKKKSLGGGGSGSGGVTKKLPKWLNLGRK